MFATWILLFIGVFCFSSILGERVVCDIDDSKCLAETLNLKFKKFITGIPGVEPSDPLYEKYIEANLPTLSYKFFNAELAGMKDCRADLVKLDKDLKYQYHIGCPHLILKAQYEISGEVGPQHIEGKGDCQVDFYDYHLQFHGDYISKAGEDGKTYINLKTHELDIVAKGKVVYDFKNLFNGDKEKSDEAHKYVNANWRAVDESTRGPAMSAFGDNIFGHVLSVLDNIPFADVFSKEK